MAAMRRLAHAELDRLGQRLADAQQAEREAESNLAATEAAVEAARDEVREAHDLNANPARAMKDLEQAKHDAEEAALRLEGIGQRVRRAAAARELYLEQNGERLLAELAPDCAQVVQDMRAHAEELLADHGRWSNLSSQVAGYLRAMNLNPAENSRGEHELATVVRDLKRALAGEIATPAPHWSARDFDREEQATRTRLREKVA
jgi:hypothetical protein